MNLLPCPFCGENKPQIINSNELGLVQKQVVCPKCGARSAVKLLSCYRDEKEWLEVLESVWNRRAFPVTDPCEELQFPLPKPETVKGKYGKTCVREEFSIDSDMENLK